MPSKTIGAVSLLFLSLALITAVPLLKSGDSAMTSDMPAEAAAVTSAHPASPEAMVNGMDTTAAPSPASAGPGRRTGSSETPLTPPSGNLSRGPRTQGPPQEPTGSSAFSPANIDPTASLSGGRAESSSPLASLARVNPPRDPSPSAYRPHPGLLGNPQVRPKQSPKPRPLRRALTPAERHLLAHLIHAEAGGEPYEGMVAVAAVVLNRLESPDFPDTVEGVVFERMAFESVSNGRLWKGTTAVAYRALDDALRGHDPSGGALYFYNPRYVRQGNWIFTRPVIQVIGQHYFAI